MNAKTTLQPFDHFEGAVLSVRGALQKNAIELHYTFTYNGEDGGNLGTLEASIPVLDIITGLQSLLVAEHCEHAYQEPLLVNKVQIGADNTDTETIICWKDQTNSLWHIQDTLYRSLAGRMPDSAQGNDLSMFHLYPVENNPLGQWASIAFAQKERKEQEADVYCGLTILQRQACLGCIRDRAKQVLEYDKTHAMTVCIIAGGRGRGREVTC